MTNISPDTPLRLRDAVKEAFPAGGITVAALRREISRGRLEAELIAGKHFVTLAAIERMRELCRVEPKEQKVATPSNSRFILKRSPGGSPSQIALRNRLEASLSRKPSRKPSHKKI
jgi:hypothetical protein